MQGQSRGHQRDPVKDPRLACSEVKRRPQSSYWGSERSFQSHLGEGREAKKEALAQRLLYHFS